MENSSSLAQDDSLLLTGPSSKDFFELLKPRVMSLVIFTALVGIYLAPEKIHPFLSVLSLLAIALGAGAAGAINQWIDRDIDKIMKRTSGRPIPSGRMDPSEAIAFAIILSIFSVILLGLASNWLAAALLGFTIFFYAFVYSICLKRYTAQNIVIGGAAGAFPPMIGWLSMTGTISFMPIFMFVLIFFWTPPHFWSLALIKSDDYEKVKIPMMPNIAGSFSTRCQIIIYSVLVFLTAVSPIYLGYTGLVYSFISIPLSTIFLIYSILILCMPNKKIEMQLFWFSIFYLFSIFMGLVLDDIIIGVNVL